MKDFRNVIRCHSVFDLKAKKALGLSTEIVTRILFMSEGHRCKFEYVILSHLSDSSLERKIIQWLYENLSPDYVIYYMESNIVDADTLSDGSRKN